MGRVAAPLAGLAPEQPFADAARRIIGVRAQEVFAQVDGVLDVRDPECLHNMRVATRRLRAAFEVFAVCFPRGELRAVTSDVKTLARALGARRDCDVQIELLVALRATVPASERKAIDKLLDGLSREQLKANRRLAKSLARAERNDLSGRLQQLSR
ncbi:MAG: CHAD domain-containing protein [Solirubrobacteraceae bacterium]|jgi:CHAD domain-containing protein